MPVLLFTEVKSFRLAYSRFSFARSKIYDAGLDDDVVIVVLVRDDNDFEDVYIQNDCWTDKNNEMIIIVTMKLRQ